MKRSPIAFAAIKRAMEWILTHRSAAGVDGVFPKRFLDDRALRLKECRLIHRLLRDGRYRFLPPRRGLLPREGKAPRVHAISTLRDAIVLRSITVELREVWALLPREITGHRPGADYRADLARISRFIADGPGWVLRFDVEQAFGSASFERAIEILCTLSKRHDLIHLIVAWRKAVGTRFEGLVEGAPIAPLLLAVLLGVEVMPHLLAIDGVHCLFADDGLSMVRTRAAIEEAQRQLDHHLARIGLRCHPEKTGIYELDAKAEAPTPWQFIGFSFRLWQPIPCAAAREDLLAQLEPLANRNQARAIARVVKGWGAYFGVSQPLDVFADLDTEMLARFGYVTKRLPSLVADVRRQAALRAPSGARTGTAKGPGVPSSTSGGVWRGRFRSPATSNKVASTSETTTSDPASGAAFGVRGTSTTRAGSPAPPPLAVWP